MRIQHVIICRRLALRLRLLFPLFSNMLYIVAVFVYLLLGFACGDLLLVGPSGTNTTIATQAFFWSRPAAVNQRLGGLVLLLPAFNNATNQCSLSPSTDIILDGSDGREPFALVRWYDTRVCNLQTMSQLWPLFHAWRATLQSPVPPARTLIIMLNRNYPGVLGNPSVEPYAATRVGIPDGAPPSDMDVILVDNDQRKLLLKAVEYEQTIPEELTWLYSSTLGPWNAVFLSVWYLALIYTVLAIDCVGIAYSMFRLGQTVYERKFKFNLRAAIFLLTLLGFILYVVSIPMSMATYADKTFENISTYLISIAFHLLLYLWSVFLMKVERSKAIYAFRGLILFGALVALLAFVTSMILSNSDPTDALIQLSNAVGFILPATQAVIGATFLYYAANFFMRRRQATRISPNTVSALTRLAQVAVIAFVGYFAVAMTNLNFIVQANAKPLGLAALNLIRLFSASVRGLAILTVMGVRQQDRKPGSSGSAYTASTKGGTGATGDAYRSRAGSTMTLVETAPAMNKY